MHSIILNNVPWYFLCCWQRQYFHSLSKIYRSSLLNCSHSLTGSNKPKANKSYKLKYALKPQIGICEFIVSFLSRYKKSINTIWSTNVGTVQRPSYKW